MKILFRAGRTVAAFLLCMAAAVAAAPVGAGSSSVAGGWSASWSGALAYAPAPGGAWSDQTLRMVARVSLGGDQIRIRLSDAFSSQPAQIGHVTVGTQLNGGTTAEPAPATVTFGSAQAFTIPAGGTVVSDPVPMPVAANTRLLVSIYIPAGADMRQAPRHDFADETSFNHAGGDVSGAQYYPTSNVFGFTTLLDGIDVDTAAPSTVVAVGDSITDGLATGSDTDTRWPNYLASRIAPLGLAVVNQGVGGNQVTSDQGASGQSLLNRWNRDVLAQPGVRTVIDADGINDLRAGVSAAGLEAAQSLLIASAHAAGVRVLLSTITPCGGEARCTSAVESQRQAYNSWVLAGASGADGVVDFDAAIDTGGYIKPIYDSGDHLHPNSAGAAALANVIDTAKL
jgi:lysophospholipase L1-like esterase